MNQIQIGKLSYSYPGSWDELTRPQIFKIISIIEKETAKEVAIRKALKLLLDFKKIGKEVGRKKIAKGLSLEDFLIFNCRKTIDFIFSPQLGKNSLEYVLIRGLKYYLPKERLSNVRLGQWATAHLYLWKFSQAPKKLDELFKALACLCLPPDQGFDPEADLDQMAHPFRTLDPIMLQLLRSYIEHNWELLYHRFKDTALRVPEEKEGEATDPKAPNWNPLIFSLTGGDLTKTNLVTEQYLLDTLLFMEDNYLKSLDQPK